MRGAIWLLSGPRIFLSRLVELASAGLSVQVKSRCGLPDDLADRICAELRAESLHADVIPAEHSPHEALGSLLGASEAKPSLDWICQACHGVRCFVVVIQDDSQLSPWRQFLDRLHHRARQEATSRRPALVLAFQASHDRAFLEDNVALKSLVWDEAVSRSDIYTLANWKLPRGRVAGIVREVLVTTLVEICLSDLELLGALLQETFEEIASPFESLRAWAEQIEVTRGGNWRDLFFEDRCYEHSASLAQRGDRSALRSRVWSAQARVLLPWVEERRQRLAQALERWLPEEFQGQSRAEYEIGVLDYLVFERSAPALLKNSVRCVKRVRNEIAHRGVLSFAQLAELPRIAASV